MAQNKILYSAKLDKNMRRSAYFETNKRSVKSNIMLKFVTQAMDIKLQCEADFTTTLEDPIKFLKRIEQFMKKSADAEYDSAVKIKAHAAIARTYTAAQDKFKDDIFEAVLTTGFLCNCNQTRTAPLMLDLQTNYCREVAYDPNTVSKAQDTFKIHMDVIKTCTKEKTNVIKVKVKEKERGNQRIYGKKAASYVCGNKDHIKDHMSPKCPDRLLPKIQWKNQDQYVDYGKKHS
ncbi:unnamed protein product [Cylindrotheca closterium]|uniref:Uncharacterized protein n=1 Tax=Cylindrotheca closterium TaxID=2856 RepID=A0AAD2FK47_9STRA|nr:unnamed protein product [Cylindrotheca closterium]